MDRGAHCNWTICQSVHRAALATRVTLSNERVRITAGEGEVTHYRSSEVGMRSFCRTRGSSMFCGLANENGWRAQKIQAELEKRCFAVSLATVSR